MGAGQRVPVYDRPRARAAAPHEPGGVPDAASPPAPALHLAVHPRDGGAGEAAAGVEQHARHPSGEGMTAASGGKSLGVLRVVAEFACPEGMAKPPLLSRTSVAPRPFFSHG